MNTRFVPESEIDKSTALGAKPFKHIEKLIDNVVPHAERHIIAKGKLSIITPGISVSAFTVTRQRGVAPSR